MPTQIPQEWTKFILKDDDGRVEEKIYDEYMALGLRYPPTFTQVSTIEEAEKVLATTSIDLVICMPGNADNDAFTVARAIKTKFPEIHCIVLTPFSHGITRRMEHEDLMRISVSSTMSSAGLATQTLSSRSLNSSRTR